jgi:oxygen-dependent protoporphyrinogen oxidase
LPEVVIVGGGVAGLAAAYQLNQMGVSFAILERAARPGGVIISEETDGFVVDGGPDALLTLKPDGIALCREIGLGDRLVSTRLPRIAYVQRGGRLHALPAASVIGIPTAIGPLARTHLFSWTGKLRMAGELFVRPKRDDADESIGDFINRRFGHEAAVFLAEPLLAGIHAGDVNRLSARALFPRFVQAEQTHGSVLRAFRREMRTAGNRATDGVFRSLPGGLSELVRALVASLPRDAIRPNSAVSAVRPAAASDGFRIDPGTGPSVDARAVVLAVPAYVIGDIVRSLDADLSRLCDSIPYTSTATVALGFPREAVANPMSGSGFVVPAVESTGILAASWLSSKWPGRAPEGRVLLRTFVGGARDPDALACRDADLIALSLRAITPILGVRGEPQLARVYRFERAHAQHNVGHLDKIAAIERALDRHPGIFVTGSGFRGVGIPDCVADARTTARAVAAYLGRSAAARPAAR